MVTDPFGIEVGVGERYAGKETGKNQKFIMAVRSSLLMKKLQFVCSDYKMMIQS
jgi:hypothetical protein